MLAQTGMGLCLIPLWFLNVEEQFHWWTRLLVLHAVFAALQDVSVDALAVNLVSESNRGRINAWMQTGMLMGRGVFGGVSIWLVSQWGLSAVMVCLTLSIWISLSVLWRFDTESKAAISVSKYLSNCRQAFKAPSLWWGCAFALTAETAFKSAGGLAGPFLVDHGADEKQSAFFFAVVVVLAMVAGSVCGGLLADKAKRLHIVQSTLFFSIAVVALLGFAEYQGASLPYLIAGLSLVYFGAGLFTASSYALFMDLTDPKLAAFQFSLFMACINGCESWSMLVAGQFVEIYGYGVALMVMACLSSFALLILRQLAARWTPRELS